MLTAVTITRLEKAATDNGFDLDLEHTADWLSFGSSQTSMRIWLTAIGESRVSRGRVSGGCPRRVGGPRRGVYRPAPERRRRRARRQRHRRTPSPVAPRIPALAHAAGRSASCLRGRDRESAANDGSRAPGGPACRSGHLPSRLAGVLGWSLRAHRPRRARATAREPHQALGRLRHGRRAPRRLQRPAARASSRCGVRLRLHHDCTEDGTVLLSDTLPPGARSALGLDGSLKIHGLHRAHTRYMQWHRSRIFRTSVENSS